MKKQVNINYLTFSSSIAYCEEIRDIVIKESCKEIELDFSKLSTIEPFGIVYFSSFIQMINRIPDLNITCSYIDDNSISYAKHMGLFQCCGFDIGKMPREHFPVDDKRYIPITIIRTDFLKKQAIESSQHVGDIVEKYSKSIAELITAEKDSDLVETLTYCFREIIRNVVEHSDSRKIIFCAQYWPYLKKAEIVVLDRGIGIKQSLNQNDTLPDIFFR